MSSPQNRPAGKALWNGNLDLRINQKYRLLERLGGGGYGEVYEVMNIENREHFAVKLEHISVVPSVLRDEAEKYKQFDKEEGFPRVIWFGYECEYRAMIFTLLGPSLDDLFNYCSRKFSLKTVLMLADQLICRIEHIHSKGIIHRDIKPENFLMGVGKYGTTVYVTDLGISTEYDNVMREPDTYPRRNGPLIGTARFASIRGHSGVEQSRRDDMESLGYLLIYFIRGSLPWQGFNAETVRAVEGFVLQKKERTSIEELCDGLPKEFAIYFHHVRSLGFGDKPNYGYLRRTFKNRFLREGFEYDKVFDWIILKFWKWQNDLHAEAQQKGERDLESLPNGPHATAQPKAEQDFNSPPNGSHATTQRKMKQGSNSPPNEPHAEAQRKQRKPKKDCNSPPNGSHSKTQRQGKRDSKSPPSTPHTKPERKWKRTSNSLPTDPPAKALRKRKQVSDSPPDAPQAKAQRKRAKKKQ